jgi:hypothetical protein
MPGMSSRLEEYIAKAVEFAARAARAADPELKATYADLARPYRPLVEHSSEDEKSQ